eukprot:5026737-Pleurochrysis_carterae.AAC.1
MPLPETDAASHTDPLSLLLPLPLSSPQSHWTGTLAMQEGLEPAQTGLERQGGQQAQLRQVQQRRLVQRQQEELASISEEQEKLWRAHLPQVLDLLSHEHKSQLSDDFADLPCDQQQMALQQLMMRLVADGDDAHVFERTFGLFTCNDPLATAAVAAAAAISAAALSSSVPDAEQQLEQTLKLMDSLPPQTVQARAVRSKSRRTVRTVDAPRSQEYVLKHRHNYRITFCGTGAPSGCVRRDQ